MNGNGEKGVDDLKTERYKRLCTKTTGRDLGTTETPFAFAKVRMYRR